MLQFNASEMKGNFLTKLASKPILETNLHRFSQPDNLWLMILCF